MTAEEPERCLLCGAPREHLHHPTSVKQDPRLLVPLCVNCHKFTHDDWHSAGVGQETSERVFLIALYLRLVRLGMFYGRLAASGRGGRLDAAMAAALALWAGRLDATAHELDERAPGWRDWPEMTE